MTSLDELLVDLDPSAIMVYGGGMTAAMAAQVAFWRQIPVVHLQAGVATDDLLCPFPQEANRRIIGQLASLFLVTAATALGSPVGPNAIAVGDTLAANPQPADLRSLAWCGGCTAAAHGWCWSGWTGPTRSACSPACPTCSSMSRTSRSCSTGSWPRTAPRYPLLQTQRVTVVASLPLADLVAAHRGERRARLRRPGARHRRRRASARPPCSSTGRTSSSRATRSAASSARPSMTTVRQVLATTAARPSPSDGLEAARVEQAVAWMFGLARHRCSSLRPYSERPRPREA